MHNEDKIKKRSNGSPDEEFERALEKMQTLESKKGTEKTFHATPEELSDSFIPEPSKKSKD